MIKKLLYRKPLNEMATLMAFTVTKIVEHQMPIALNTYFSEFPSEEQITKILKGIFEDINNYKPPCSLLVDAFKVAQDVEAHIKVTCDKHVREAARVEHLH